MGFSLPHPAEMTHRQSTTGLNGPVHHTHIHSHEQAGRFQLTWLTCLWKKHENKKGGNQTWIPIGLNTFMLYSGIKNMTLYLDIYSAPYWHSVWVMHVDVNVDICGVNCSILLLIPANTDSLCTLGGQRSQISLGELAVLLDRTIGNCLPTATSFFFFFRLPLPFKKFHSKPWCY